MKDIVELGEKVGAEPYPEYDEEKKEYKYPNKEINKLYKEEK